MRSPLRTRRRPLSSAEYWNHSDAVASMPPDLGALPYETAGVAEAVERAGGSDDVHLVHVIGVGGGRELPLVVGAAPSAMVEAWDISSAMVHEARAFVAGRPDLSSVSVSVGDIAAGVPLGPPGDVVIATNAVLGYVRPDDRRRGAFGAIAAMLRPGGAVMAVVQQRNGRPDWTLWFGVQWLLARVGLADGDPGDVRNTIAGRSLLVHHYTPRELRQHLQAVGFEDISVRSLRSWARGADLRLPARSPNPLIVVAARR